MWLVEEQFVQALRQSRPAIEDGIAYEQWRNDVKAIQAITHITNLLDMAKGPKA